MALFKKRTQGRSAGGADGTAKSDPAKEVSRMKAFSEGRIPCVRCEFLIPMKSLRTLQMVECPKCQGVNFVPRKISHYWLFEPLGGGGMGSVYRALSTKAPGEQFAVKVLSRTNDTSPTNVHALLNEARIGQIIGDHPCLVKCYDHGCYEGEYFCAMALVDGERLDKRIDLLGRLPEKQVLKLALHILAAEQHILQCGYLYRDLKPENIIIGADGYGVLLDYGLCLSRDAAANPGDEFVAGSPYYLPPERLLGEGEDAHSEIYSLGMVMYYAISGQTYYDASEVESLAKRHVSRVRLSVSSKMKGFPEDLVAVLSRMVAQDPKERYRTFHEVAADIKAVLDSRESSQ